jgi:hypothetical protein
VLHVLTVHWQSSAWIEPQLRYLRRYAPDDTRVWACLNGIDPSFEGAFDFTVSLDGTHPEKLNQLADIVATKAAPSDHLLFIDGDALPLRPLEPMLYDRFPLAAVRRDENFGDPQPHPCFCITSLAFWREIEGDWNRGYTWKNELGLTVTDPGANVLKALLERELDWRPLCRMNTNNEHPIWFGVYGDAEYGPVAYHHGAGFRKRVARTDTMTAGFAFETQRRPLRSPSWVPGARRIERKWRNRSIVRKRNRWERRELPKQEALADTIFQGVLDGDDIVHRFVGSAT